MSLFSFSSLHSGSMIVSIFFTLSLSCGRITFSRKIFFLSWLALITTGFIYWSTFLNCLPEHPQLHPPLICFPLLILLNASLSDILFSVYNAKKYNNIHCSTFSVIFINLNLTGSLSIFFPVHQVRYDMLGVSDESEDTTYSTLVVFVYGM